MSTPTPSSNGAPSRSVLTGTRVVALALLALLIVGLVSARFTMADTDPMAVPPGAAAGDLVLEPCEYPTETGSLPAECGTLVVPETRGDPASRLIALPLTRVRASSANPAEPVFFLAGGPGASNMGFAHVDQYARDRDFVLVGYRGVDGSVRLDCPEVEGAVGRASDALSPDYFREYAAAYRACANRVVEEGIDPTSYGLVQQVDDLEAARIALGYDRVNLLSESAGTRTAQIYAWRYPGSLYRSVMVAVNPPGAFLWDADVTTEQVQRYARLCARDADCRARTPDLAATMSAPSGGLPARWLFLPIKEGNVRAVSMYGLFESTPKAGLANAPLTIDAWLTAAEGDPSGMWMASLVGDLLFPELFVRGQHAAAGLIDAQASRDYFAAGLGDVSNLGRAATAFGWGGGALGDAWPEPRDSAAYRQVRTSQVETLLVGGELDVSTPPQIASEQLLPYLPNGQEVVLPRFGHTLSLLEDQPAAAGHLINTYLATGTVDASRYVSPEIDFTPATTFPWLAKVTLGALLGLAGLTIVSLVVLAGRAHSRGRIGPVAGALVRSVYAVVLGIGGWSLGALIVLTAVPTARVVDPLVVSLSAGAAVALGVYLAWVRRAWPTTVKAAGVLAAAAGGLVGAWLGFAAVPPPMVMGSAIAIVTAVLGAVVGANLAVIIVDLVRAGRAATPPDRAGRAGTPSDRAGHQDDAAGPQPPARPSLSRTSH